jgi:hypothetical protein
MGYTLISQITSPTSNAIEFSGLSLSGYDDVQVKLEGVTVGTDNVSIVAQFAIGGSLVTSGYRYHSAILTTGGVSVDADSTSAASMLLTRITTNAVGNASGESFAGIYQIGNPNEALHKYLRGHASYTADDGNLRHVRSLGLLANTGTLDGLKFFLSSGTMPTGKASIWGIPNT